MGRWCVSLLGCTRLECAGETDLHARSVVEFFKARECCRRQGASRCVLPLCGQRVGAKFCEPELQKALVHMHGDLLRGRRGSGRRTGSSTLLMKKPSSSTLSRSQARGCSSACGARAEAGRHDSFESFFDRCADPVTRFRRVTSSSSGFSSHAHSTARNSQLEHSRATVVHGWLSLNSENSVGDTEDGGQRFCVPGGTKSLSTSTRTGVRRSAVYGPAHTQQTPLKLHVETWEGLLRNQGTKIFREVEIVPGCAVRVACPSCPDYYLEPPGPGIVIRNMLGWSRLVKTERSGVWVFRGALQGENLFSLLDAAGDWERKGSYHTAWAVPCSSSCSCSYAYGLGPAIGPHTGERCWPLLAGVWRAIAPLMQPWCAEGEVPTAANLNLYRRMEIVCWLALR